MKLMITPVVLSVLLILTSQTVRAYTETASSYQDGYDQGYNDAIGGFSYYVGPDHTPPYKDGYQQGYRDGIDKTHNTPVVSNNERSTTTGSQALGQNSQITVNGDNNNVKVTQSQAGSQNLDSNSPTLHASPPHHYTQAQRDEIIGNAFIPPQ